jgi:hypothetical protein
MQHLIQNLDTIAKLTAQKMIIEIEPLINAAFLIITDDVNDNDTEILEPYVNLMFDIRDSHLKDLSLQITIDGDDWITINTRKLRDMVDEFLKALRKQTREIKLTEEGLNNTL